MRMVVCYGVGATIVAVALSAGAEPPPPEGEVDGQGDWSSDPLSPAPAPGADQTPGSAAPPAATPPQGYPAYPPPTAPPIVGYDAHGNPIYAYQGYPQYPQYAPYAPSWEYLPYREGETPPPGYVLDYQRRRGPIIAGSIVFGIAYLFSLLVATSEATDDDFGWLAMPVLGPWIVWADADCSDCRSARSLLVIDGLMQGTGAALFLYGMLSRKPRWARADVAGITLLPLASQSGASVTALGRF